MGKPGAFAQGQALRFLADAHAMVQHQFGDFEREVVAIIARDEMEHEIERRGAARAGKAVAIDFEQPRGDIERGEIFRKAGHILPMDRAAIAFEQPGPRQQHSAGTHRAEHRPHPRGTAQRGKQRGAAMAFGIEPRTDHDHVGGLCFGQRAVGRDPGAIACGDNTAVDGCRLPVIKIGAAFAVGRTQRLDRRRIRHHREFGHDHEQETTRGAFGQGLGHGAGPKRKSFVVFGIITVGFATDKGRRRAPFCSGKRSR